MPVFYTEGKLAIHHHSSRGRGNVESFLYNAFHHNTKKSQWERESKHRSAKCTSKRVEMEKKIKTSEKSLLISLQIYSLQGLGGWELSTGSSSRQGCSSAEAWPSLTALGMQMMGEGQGKFGLLSSWGIALVQLPCTTQSSNTQHRICEGHWAASSNSGSQGGIFQTKAECNQGEVGKAIPRPVACGTGRYRGRPLQAEACWINEGSWCLPLLRVHDVVRFSAEGPVTLIGIQQNLVWGRRQNTSKLRSQTSCRLSRLGWNFGRQDMPVGHRIWSIPGKMMVITPVIKSSRKWVFESSLSHIQTHTTRHKPRQALGEKVVAQFKGN